MTAAIPAEIHFPSRRNAPSKALKTTAQQTITSACHHCEDPGCMNGCPVLAYDKDPVTGIVRHLDDLDPGPPGGGVRAGRLAGQGGEERGLAALRRTDDGESHGPRLCRGLGLPLPTSRAP